MSHSQQQCYDLPMQTQDFNLTLAAPTQNLHRLLIIRCLLLCGLGLLLGISHQGLALALPYPQLIVIITAMAAINLLTFARLQRHWPVTRFEFFTQLLIDIIAISLLLYFSGGASNPFVSYYLVPLSIAAATLPTGYAWAIAGLSLLAYSCLLFFNVPLPSLAPHHGNHGDGINLHIIGMWFNFLLSAALISYFVVKMAGTLRRQQSQIGQHREDNLRDEQLMAVATLAAGTAHELGTPLSTMKILVDEMRDDYQQPDFQPDKLRDDLTLLAQQLDQCGVTLKQLTYRAQQKNITDTQPQSLSSYCEDLLQRWQLMRPEVNSNIEWPQDPQSIETVIPATVEQSIINVLNNAADASADDIRISINWDTDYLQFDIYDRGRGIPNKLAEQLGKPFITTKGKGLGLGLFLTHASLSRYGGTVKLFNRQINDKGLTGTHSEIRIPLAATRAQESKQQASPLPESDS